MQVPCEISSINTLKKACAASYNGNIGFTIWGKAYNGADAPMINRGGIKWDTMMIQLCITGLHCTWP